MLFSVVSFQSSAKQISFEQCDNELATYCAGAEYNTTAKKQQCVEKKQKLFTQECVAIILGIDNNSMPEITEPQEEQKDTKEELENINNKTTSIMIIATI